MKGLLIAMPVHRIGDEESPEKQKLREDKKPYAQLGTFVVPVYIMMCNRFCHRIQL